MVNRAEYNICPELCLNCGFSISFENRFGKFCSKSCSASFNNKGKCRNKFGINGCGQHGSIYSKPVRLCPWCSSVMDSGNLYCSKECKKSAFAQKRLDKPIIICSLCPNGVRNNAGLYCAKCLMRLRRYKQKVDAVEYKGSCCHECGRSGDICIFDFHHLGDKKDTVSNLIASNRKWEIIAEELDKCEMYCCLCHRRLHDICSCCLQTRIDCKCRLRLKRYKTKLKAIEYKGACCKRCKWASKCTTDFDFHHLYDKKFSISSYIISNKWETIQNELDKCDMLCGVCHRLEHASDRNHAFLEEVNKYFGLKNGELIEVDYGAIKIRN